MTQESADIRSYSGGGVVVQENHVSLCCDGESQQGQVSLVSSYNLCPKPTTYTTLKLQSHGTTQATLMTRRLDMVTFQTTLRRRRLSSITVITSAVRLTSQMIKLASLNMMHIFHTVNSLQTNTHQVKTYRTSSTASSSMRKLACIIMVQGI